MQFIVFFSIDNIWITTLVSDEYSPKKLHWFLPVSSVPSFSIWIKLAHFSHGLMLAKNDFLQRVFCVVLKYFRFFLPVSFYMSATIEILRIKIKVVYALIIKQYTLAWSLYLSLSVCRNNTFASNIAHKRTHAHNIYNTFCWAIELSQQLWLLPLLLLLLLSSFDLNWCEMTRAQSYYSRTRIQMHAAKVANTNVCMAYLWSKQKYKLNRFWTWTTRASKLWFENFFEPSIRHEILSVWCDFW